ncbi:MAG TPA: NUDIX hydrolase N-terminal domain-containing protein [bacterium]
MAQTGLTYSSANHFDVERYTRIREIAPEIMLTDGIEIEDLVMNSLKSPWLRNKISCRTCLR